MFNMFKKYKEEKQRILAERDQLKSQLVELTAIVKSFQEKEEERKRKEQERIEEEQRLERLAQEERERKNAAKELATKNNEPYFAIVDTTVDLTDGNVAGSFEFDWNDLFIDELKKAGYPGETDEQIVDNWYRNICKHVWVETHEQAIADISIATPKRKDLGDGLAEYQ